MKYIRIPPLLLVCAVILLFAQPAFAAKCGCGSAFLVFHPPAAQEVFFYTDLGGVSIMQGGSGGGGNYRSGEHWCECFEPEQGDALCKYSFVPGSSVGFYDDVSGGCTWRNMDGTLWCFDVACSDDPQGPVVPAE